MSGAMAGMKKEKPPPPWKEISRRRREIEADRRVKVLEAMRAYDEGVFFPALKQLRKDCAAHGHGSVNYDDNGFGTYWTTCIRCGGRVKQWTEGHEGVSA